MFLVDAVAGVSFISDGAMQGLVMFLKDALRFVVAVAVAAPLSAQSSYQPGQPVQYKDGSEWIEAEFLRLTPSGKQAIVREKNVYSSDGYFERAVNMDRMRSPVIEAPRGAPVAKPAQTIAPQARAATARPGVASVQTGSPRSGDYDVYSYGRPSNPLRLGRINLSGGTYRFYDNGDGLLGQGQYSFASGSVTWRTGLLKGYGWGGTFKIERGGREHSIRLNRVTYAINSR